MYSCTGKTLICVECGTPVEALYSNFPGSANIRIELCKICGKPIDPYIEYDVSLILLDLMLLSKTVWRHVLFNVKTNHLHWKLAVVCCFCDGYMKWVTGAPFKEEKFVANELVFKAAAQIQLYIYTLVSLVELFAFLLLTVFFYFVLKPLLNNCSFTGDKYSLVASIFRCLLLASTGKFLYIPTIIWMHDGSMSYLQLILLYVVFCSAISLSLTVECTLFQALIIVVYSYFFSILLVLPFSKSLFTYGLYLQE